MAALLYSSSAVAQLAVTVDRTQIALDETVNLTITKDGITSLDSDELRPLEKDFLIRGQSQSTSAQYINGTMSSSFTMQLVLAPKTVGNLQIPALMIGKEKSAPIALKVVSQAEPKTRADNAPLFIETEVSVDTVFVQSQLIYTLRIFWAVEASINEPVDPQLDGALIERLNDATFDKIVDGRSYKVFERKYAIFPQRSGVLEIPQIVVQATVADLQPQRRNNVYGFFGSRGKEVKLRSEGVRIAVKEKVAEYPVGREWLPTAKLSIAEEWSQDLAKLQVGESATITIALAAQGMLGEQLPPISLGAADGVKLYQGKAEVQNLKNSDGITGIRKESIALIPTRPGKMVLPEIRIPWWNIARQKVEYAVVPARNLVVSGGAIKNNTTSPVVAPATIPEAQVNKALAKTAPREKGFDKFLLLFGAMSLGWLLTIIWLVKTRHRLAKVTAGGGLTAGNIIAGKEKDAFAEFARACRLNEAFKARKAALNWARSARPEARVQTAADLDRLFPGSGLASLLEEIDDILYSQNEALVKWHGRKLLESVERIRKTSSNKKEPVLQELYR